MGMPWSLRSDLQRAESGLMSRDSRAYGRCERQYALAVVGSVDHSLSLGMVAIRCNRQGATIEPLTLSIPDTVEP